MCVPATAATHYLSSYTNIYARKGEDNDGRGRTLDKSQRKRKKREIKPITLSHVIDCTATQRRTYKMPACKASAATGMWSHTCARVQCAPVPCNIYESAQCKHKVVSL